MNTSKMTGGISCVTKPIVTFCDDSDRNDRKFATPEKGRAFLKSAGFKFMAKRRNPHGFMEEFYAKSVRAYNAGQYVTLCY